MLIVLKIDENMIYTIMLILNIKLNFDQFLMLFRMFQILNYVPEGLNSFATSDMYWDIEIVSLRGEENSKLDRDH